jgi:aarF domain-containing kinase
MLAAAKLSGKVLLASAGTGFGVALVANKDKDFHRPLQFWKGVFPIYMHYRWYQLLNRDLGIMDDEEADKNYRRLHELYTDEVKDIVYRLRGFYLKNAQVMSMQDDFVPEAYMKWVKDTQDNVPSEFVGSGAREYVRRKLKEELNVEFEDVFSYWDDEPLGVASIGEVHRAVLKGSKKEVAVKLLCPGMEEKFRSDISTIKSFCRLAMPQHVPAMDEIEKQFITGMFGIIKHTFFAFLISYLSYIFQYFLIFHRV